MKFLNNKSQARRKSIFDSKFKDRQDTDHDIEIV